MKLKKIQLGLGLIASVVIHNAFAVDADYAGTGATVGSNTAITGSGYATVFGTVPSTSLTTTNYGSGSGSYGATAGPGSVASYGPGSYKLYKNNNNTAIGQNANAGYGVQENPDFVDGKTAAQYYGDGRATAIGANSVAKNGGTAVGEEASATGKDSVAIGKEANSSGYKAITLGEDSGASAAYSMAVGNGAQATARDSSAFGVDAAVDGESSIALGARANVSGNNSVALGADSVATRNNTVSVGSAGSERTISNLAAGVYGTDAVNLNQLQATEKKLSSGIAAAMAMTTPVILPGKSNAVALGVGYYNQAGAVSLNLAHKFSEEIVATASGSYGFNSQSIAQRQRPPSRPC